MIPCDVLSLISVVGAIKGRGGHHVCYRCGSVRCDARELCPQGFVRFGPRLCDGRIRSAYSGLHAVGDRRRTAFHAGAIRLASDLDTGRRGHWRRGVRCSQRLFRPHPRADLDHSVVRDLHRPVRLRARLLGSAGLSHHRRARSRWRVRHRHGAGGRSLAGLEARASVVLCRPRLAGGRAARGDRHADLAAARRLARHVRHRHSAGGRRFRGPLYARRAADLRREDPEAHRQSACVAGQGR